MYNHEYSYMPSTLVSLATGYYCKKTLHLDSGRLNNASIHARVNIFPHSYNNPNLWKKLSQNLDRKGNTNVHLSI